jgi:hypothetical protein
VRLEEAVKPPAEGIPIHVEEVLEVPCILAIRAFRDVEEFFLSVAVAWIALADVREVHVDEVFEGSAVDVAHYMSVHFGVGFGILGSGNKDLCFVRSVEALHDVLAVLSSPAAIARKTSCC